MHMGRYPDSLLSAISVLHYEADEGSLIELRKGSSGATNYSKKQGIFLLTEFIQLCKM